MPKGRLAQQPRTGAMCKYAWLPRRRYKGSPRGNAAMKLGQPAQRVVADLGADLIQQLDVVGRAGEDVEDLGHAAEVELDDRRAMSLLDEEHATALAERLDDSKLRLRALEAEHVVVVVSTRIGQVHLRHALLDHGLADPMPQHIRGRLRHEDAESRLLTNRLLLVEREVAEGVVHQRLPELLHEQHEWLAVNEALGDVQQVRHDRRAHLRVVEKLGVVEAEDASVGQLLQILRVVEAPPERLFTGPLLESLAQAVVARATQALIHGRERAHLEADVLAHHAAHRGADLVLLAGNEGRQSSLGAGNEALDEAFAELDVRLRRVELKRVEAGGLATLEGDVLSAHRADADLGATVLVEEDAAQAAVLHGEGKQRHLERRLADAGRAADESIAGILLVARVLVVRRDVEVQVERLAARRLHQGERLAPGVAGALAACEVVQGAEAGEVAAADRCLTRAHRPVPRQLGEPGAFRDGVDDGHLESWPVLQQRPGLRH